MALLATSPCTFAAARAKACQLLHASMSTVGVMAVTACGTYAIEIELILHDLARAQQALDEFSLAPADFQPLRAQLVFQLWYCLAP